MAHAWYRDIWIARRNRSAGVFCRTVVGNRNLMAVDGSWLPTPFKVTGMWRARRDSNPRPLVPKTSALSAELRAPLAATTASRPRHRPPANNTGRPPEAALSRTAHIESSATPYCRQTFCRISRDEEEPHRGSWRQYPVERAAINVARPCPCSASQTKAKSSALVSSVPISATVFMSESESTAAAQSDPAGARATSGTRAGIRPRVLE